MDQALESLLTRGLRVGAHVDIFKNDEHGQPAVLVHTSRPCSRCGFPLIGMVESVKGRQRHVRCPERGRHG